MEFEWDVPNPSDYTGINPNPWNPWHFCLLARIESADDPMTFPEGEFITENVLNNNNIAWKNVTVINISAESSTPVGGTIAVSNPFSNQRNFTLELRPQQNELGKALYDEAEITITLDSILYDAWSNGGKNKFEAEEINPKKLKVNGSESQISNLILEPGAYATAYVSFNFLIKELTEKQKYTYHVFQRDDQTNMIMGGETFEINKYQRDSFSANAGEDKEVERNETITLTADIINEDASYNWYDFEGNLIHSGIDLTITPEMTKNYKLEVISNVDGFKDFDEVQVIVNPYKIESLIPNPAFNQVAVNYFADGANSAYLMVVNINSGNSDNYILDVQKSSINIDISSYTSGLYNVVLVCNGEIQNLKTLLKQ